MTTATKSSNKKRAGGEPLIDPSMRGGGGGGTGGDVSWLADVLAAAPVQMIPLSEIREPEEHSRILPALDQVKLRALGESIKRDGLLQKILVYRGVSGKFERVFGSRRCDASRLVGLKVIAAHVLNVIPSDTEVQRMRAAENFCRRDFSEAERALQVKHSYDAHVPMKGNKEAIKTVAAELGMEEKRVQDCLYIVERLESRTREILHAGGITLGHARQLTKIAGKDQVAIAEEIARSLKVDEKQGNVYGRGYIWSDQEVANAIANRKASLRVVPWDLRAAMKTGVEGCSVCVGCHWNSATDKVLFDTSGDEMFEVKPSGESMEPATAGCCLNPTGFAAKQKLLEKAREKMVQAIKADVKGKKIDKQVAASAEVIREHAPAWMKPASAKRTVEKELGIVAPAKPKAESGAAPAAKEPERLALREWVDAFDQWSQDVNESISEAAKKDPMLRLGLILIGMIDLPTYYLNSNGTKPNNEKPLTPTQSRLLDSLAARRDLSDILELAEAAKPDLDTYDAPFHLSQGLQAGPELAKRLVKACGVKVEDPPVFEDFMAKAKGEEKPAKKA